MRRLSWIAVLIAVSGITGWLVVREVGQAGSEENDRATVAAPEAEPAPAAVKRAGAPPEAIRAPEPSTDRLAVASASKGIRGRVVDHATDLPIAELTIVVGKGDEERVVTSDEEGVFRLELDPGSQRFGARLFDGAKVKLAKRIFRIHEGDTELELRAKIGPRYLIEIVGPPEAREADWTAHLVDWIERERMDLIGVERVPARPLEPGDPRAVRFSRLPNVDEDAGLQLVLRDSTGEWSGSTTPPTLVGEPPEVLLIEVSHLGLLTGRVVESGGIPVHRATVHLTPTGGLDWPRIESEWKIQHTDEEGRFRFERLELGDYHMRIAPPHRPMIPLRVHIPAGHTDLGEIEVPGGGEKGVVAGVIKSSAGRGGIGAILQLESLDGTGWARSTIAGGPSPLMSLFYGGRADQESGEETEASFRLEGVPAGRYRLVVVPWDGRRYEPSVIELEAPTEEVVVWREDSAEDVGFGFLVVDKQTGESIPEWQARFHTRRWGKEKSFPHRSGEILGRLAPDGDLSFAIFADGYAPVWGDASRFAALEGDPRLLKVELDRGWGAEFNVRDGRDPRRHHHRSASVLSISAPGEHPLEGVRVFADGELVGESDAEGRVRVVLGARPAAIQFGLTGWTTTSTTTFADGAVLLDCPSPKVWMVPEEGG